MRDTERGRDIGRERSRLPDSIPGPRDHNLSQRQILNHWAMQLPFWVLWCARNQAKSVICDLHSLTNPCPNLMVPWLLVFCRWGNQNSRSTKSECIFIYLCCNYRHSLREPLEIITNLFCLNVTGRIKWKTCTYLVNLPFIRMKNAFCDQLS